MVLNSISPDFANYRNLNKYVHLNETKYLITQYIHNIYLILPTSISYFDDLF